MLNMTAQHQWVKKIAHRLESQGWRVREGKRHHVFYPPNKDIKPFTVANTPSDRYGRKNAIKQLQRAGASIDEQL